jgi:predicted metalloprotease
MKQFVLAVIVAGILFMSQVNCFAFPVGPSAVREAYDRARVVFIGQVTEINNPISSAPTASEAERLYRVIFKVEYSWKGAGFQELAEPKLIVLSKQGRDDCGLDVEALILCNSRLAWLSLGSFSEGRKYLVYAEESAEKDLIVQLTSRTVPLFKASEDLKELEGISNPFYGLRVNR